MWDYPRPPRLEVVDRRVVVVLGGQTIAEATRCFRVLETSHPPVYYVAPGDIRAGALTPAGRRSFCEFKGAAVHWNVSGGDRIEVDAAWSYPEPAASYAALRNHVAFYPARMDACFVDGERVRPQPGGYYGGWITDAVVGPFKGGPGTRGW
ncbi:MAG: hypothetical protein JWL73_2269 [Actinomycetia bacterium]|nr:hypothetical protein [Actinomycetes bacterium]